MERMKLTEKEKEQILKSGAEAMSRIIEKMSIEMGELEEENKKLKEDVERLIKLSEHKTTTIMGLGKNLDEVKEENKKLESENEELKEAMKELNNYNKFLIQENERQKSKTITVTDEDNRVILEKGEDGKRHSYGGGNVVLC